MLDGVHEHVGYDPRELAGIAEDDRRVLIAGCAEFDALPIRDRLELADRIAHQIGDRHWLEVQTERAGLDPGEFEQVVHHARQAGHLAAHQPVVPGRVLDKTILEGFSHRAYPGEGGPEVMGDVRDEITACTLRGRDRSPRLCESSPAQGQFGRQPGEFRGRLRGGTVVCLQPRARYDETVRGLVGVAECSREGGQFGTASGEGPPEDDRRAERDDR